MKTSSEFVYVPEPGPPVVRRTSVEVVNDEAETGMGRPFVRVVIEAYLPDTLNDTEIQVKISGEIDSVIAPRVRLATRMGHS